MCVRVCLDGHKFSDGALCQTEARLKIYDLNKVTLTLPVHLKKMQIKEFPLGIYFGTYLIWRVYQVSHMICLKVIIRCAIFQFMLTHVENRCFACAVKLRLKNHTFTCGRLNEMSRSDRQLMQVFSNHCKPYYHLQQKEA